MTDITFRLDPEILAGIDTITRAGLIVAAVRGRSGGRAALVTHALIITERPLVEAGLVERLSTILKDAGIDSIVCDDGTMDTIQAAVEVARGGCCAAVIGFGGERIQVSARIAAIIANSKQSVCDLLDRQETVSPEEVTPYIAIPTAECDVFLFLPYFVAVDPRDRSVKIVNAPRGLCRAVIIDGNLFEALTDSARHPAAAAFNGFGLALESYCSVRAHFIAEGLLEQAMSLYGRIMRRYEQAPQAADSAAASDQDVVSAYTGAGALLSLGIAASAPGIGTALACALSGRFQANQTWCSTALLGGLVEKLIAVRPEKVARAAALLGEPVDGLSTADAATRLGALLQSRMEALHVPSSLSALGLDLDRLGPVAEMAQGLEFASFSPWTVTTEEAFALLKRAY